MKNRAIESELSMSICSGDYSNAITPPGRPGTLPADPEHVTQAKTIGWLERISDFFAHAGKIHDGPMTEYGPPRATMMEPGRPGTHP